MWTGMMRTHHFATFRAFGHTRRHNPIMRPAHISLGCARFSLWNCHSTLLQQNSVNRTFDDFAKLIIALDEQASYDTINY